MWAKVCALVNKFDVEILEILEAIKVIVLLPLENISILVYIT